jgi:hypothetical protein
MKMIDKDPLGYSVVTYAWVVSLAIWGGVVHFIQRLKRGEAKAHNIVELVGEVVISAFVGIITFYLCELSAFPQILTAALVAVSGHMGTRSLFFFEKALEKIIKNKTGAL